MREIAAVVGIGIAMLGLAILVRPAPEIRTIEKPVVVKEPVFVDKPVVVKEPVFVDKPVVVREPKIVYVDKPQIVEKVVEKPVDRVIEKVVEKPVETSKGKKLTWDDFRKGSTTFNAPSLKNTRKQDQSHCNKAFGYKRVGSNPYNPNSPYYRYDNGYGWRTK